MLACSVFSITAKGRTGARSPLSTPKLGQLIQKRCADSHSSRLRLRMGQPSHPRKGSEGTVLGTPMDPEEQLHPAASMESLLVPSNG